MFQDLPKSSIKVSDVGVIELEPCLVQMTFHNPIRHNKSIKQTNMCLEVDRVNIVCIECQSATLWFMAC